MNKLTILSICTISLLLAGCQTKSFVYEGKKLEGVSLVAPPKPIGAEAMQELDEVGLEWVSLMPYAFTEEGGTELYYNLERQWWGERDEGLIETIRLAREAQLQVMLKPHLWLRGGSFTGDLSFSTEAQWQAWEKAYTGYILHQAHIADSMQVPLFCLGTELTQHNMQRPDYWAFLIDTLRTVYGGQLTYAANWDAVEAFPHWDKVDFIGVDAYFPLSKEDSPTPDQLKKGWQPHLRALQTLAGRHQKPILFTEWGYRSIQATAREPWRSDTEGTNSAEAQKAAYEAFFQQVWTQPWVAGAFLWKWYPQQPRRHHKLETDFTPQGKPALDVVRQYYGDE